MKAKVVEVWIPTSDPDYAHDKVRPVNMLWISEKALLVMPDFSSVRVYDGISDQDENWRVLREVEVPDEIGDKILAWLKAKRELYHLSGMIYQIVE